MKDLKRSANKAEWKSKKYNSQSERKEQFCNLSGAVVPPLVCSEDISEFDEPEKLGFPGEFPYTRGVQPTMYRGKLWTMRQFAGFGSPDDTNRRFKYLLSQGITGLSTAFDMPTLMGYDADHPRSLGEVGREGVSVSSIDDLARLFNGIDLAEVSTSMTINCSAAPVLAMYFALAKRAGIELNRVRGTIQNDILKEYIAQKEWICPPRPALRIVGDMIEFCSSKAKKFNAVSVSGYHIREAGATAVQELAFTIYNGITYVEHCLERGLDVDTLAPQLSFFFDVHNDFFEEVAKLRAARRLWANLMKHRFGAKTSKAMRLRTHVQTAGVSLTAQQPMNNVARVAIQALAGVLGGTQSLHTNSMDETLALPTREAVTVALRTQQIIAEETGVANTIDPLAGSYFVEDLTNKIEAAAKDYVNKLDELGGMLRAIDLGFPQKEIAEAASEFQRQVENGERVIVGVNKYVDSKDENATPNIPTLKIPREREDEQIKRLAAFKSKRNKKVVSKHLEALKKACQSQQNLMPILIEAVDQGVTVGEVSEIYRDVFGEYHDPGFF